jgi:hypothetical protein
MSSRSSEQQDDQGHEPVLRCGMRSGEVPVPAYFQGWRRVRLDIDPTVQPDLLLDARQLGGCRRRATTRCTARTTWNTITARRDHDYSRLRSCAQARGLSGDPRSRPGGAMRSMVERRLDLEDVAYETPVARFCSAI